jgi:hypothetical protein
VGVVVEAEEVVGGLNGCSLVGGGGRDSVAFGYAGGGWERSIAGSDPTVGDVVDEKGEEEAGHDYGGCGAFVVDGPADAAVGEVEVSVRKELDGEC